jgi:tRNA(Ile)-lysidine synthase
MPEAMVATANPLEPKNAPIDRFRRDLDPLVGADLPIGIAVSGGHDSLALLLMAAEARPLGVEAATVDHRLRPESRAEAELVAGICERLGVTHVILTAQWDEKPQTALQERARAMRYRLLNNWASERGLAAILTAHHLDDQAETFLMRLARGAGVQGLAGMRRVARLSETSVPIVRPLLGWRHSELVEVCAEAGVTPVDDPSNADREFERVRVREALADSALVNAQQVAASAAHLAQADIALQWATTREWQRGVTAGGGEIVYRPADAPLEIRRRIIRRAVHALATEGRGIELRGRELEQLIISLAQGKKMTLRGVLCTGGREWRFAKAPERRQPRLER